MSKSAVIVTKSEKFMYDMVTADFYGFRNVMMDMQANEKLEKILAETGLAKHADFIESYSLLRQYTMSMRFEWDVDTPDHIKSLETWWKMIENGESETDAYVFYASSVSHPMNNAYYRAFTKAHAIWKPSRERTMGAGSSEADETDPK